MRVPPQVDCLARLREATLALGYDLVSQEGLQELAISVGISAESLRALFEGRGDWNLFHELASGLKIETTHLFSGSPALITVFGYEGGDPIRISCPEGLPVRVAVNNLFWLRISAVLSEQTGMPHEAVVIGSRVPRSLQPGAFYTAESPTSFAVLKCITSEGDRGLFTDRSGSLQVNGYLRAGGQVAMVKTPLPSYGITGVLQQIVMPLSPG